MQKKIRQLSIKTFALSLLIVMVIFFLIFAFINNRLASNLLLDHVYENTENSVDFYKRQVDETLDQIETYLYTTALSDSYYTNLTQPGLSDTTWYVSIHYLDQNFSNALLTYNADGFLFYSATRDTFLFSNQLTAPSYALQQSFRSIISDNTVLTGWQFQQIDDAYYLIRILRLGNGRIGAVISLDTLLDAISASYSEAEGLYLNVGDSLLYGLNGKIISLDFDSFDFSHAVKKIDGQKMIVVQKPLQSSYLRLVQLLSYADVQKLNASQNRATFLTVFLFLVACFSLAYFVQRYMIQPVTNLTNALQQVAEGNWEEHVPDSDQLMEYHQMSDAYNGMVSEIKNLKIDVYEEKLQYQELENQFLKQQITPHFMINCLNTACQLTETDHLDLARSMLIDLSKHMRYTLSSGSQVPLSEDLELVRNYLEISKIRYPNSLVLFVQCPEAFQDATVVPLLLLNFVENTIKHEVKIGTLLEIHIEISSYREQDKTRLHVCIWDTGGGFSPQMLATITSPDFPTLGDNSQIGISNVIFRMRHVFPDVRFVFSNRPNSGAQIDIDFPFFPYNDPKERTSTP